MNQSCEQCETSLLYIQQLEKKIENLLTKIDELEGRQAVQNNREQYNDMPLHFNRMKDYYEWLSETKGETKGEKEKAT
jgi:hypothetical protein